MGLHTHSVSLGPVTTTAAGSVCITFFYTVC